ncbi:hypothetical protein [Arthrobacter bambusae]|uniref:hypothetical protein n=1 Tax=Arthrobacter bambusae TaxID=1338426 RepID=UPI002784FB07|nr:hypothetical protein [Arthrobacter bambusae]MDQ0031517.1 hypothetical protein [Arthrobacter bambusae]MDQ0099740.1 hypothetical protein [Arthrobacter bambusae]
MSISTDTITAIFDRHDVQDEHRQDPELLGAAYAMAFLEEPNGGAEQRFYDAWTILPGDTPDEPSYEMPNRAMLTEVYDARIRHRSHVLEMEDLMAEADPAGS